MGINNELIRSQKTHPTAETIPSIHKRRVQWIILLGILFFCYSTAAHSNNQEDLQLLRDRIQSLQKDLIGKVELKQETSEALQRTAQTISVITGKLTELKEEDRKAITEHRQFQNQYQEIKSKTELERNRLEKLLYQQYIAGKQDYFRLALNQQNPNQIARAAHYHQRLSLARIDDIKALQSDQEKLETLIQSGRRKKEEIVAIQAEYFDQRKKLEQEKVKQQNLLTQVSEQIDKQRQEIDKLRKNEKQLTNLIEEINKAVAQKESKTIGSALINRKLPDASLTNAPFSTFKGKLNLPVQGKLVNAFGGQRSGKQLTWKGLFIQSNEGNEVKAISPGKVVFADWLRGFGNLIILDHGSGYMSLYGNNATLRKQVGETIRSGETIAIVGNSSGNLDTGLYFELRHQGKPFDPLTWIKIE